MVWNYYPGEGINPIDMIISEGQPSIKQVPEIASLKYISCHHPFGWYFIYLVINKHF